jgi:hypothetical protein
MNEIINIIGLPLIAGMLLFLVPENLRFIKGLLALTVSVVTFCFAFSIFGSNFQLVKLSDIYPATGLSVFGNFPVG